MLDPKIIEILQQQGWYAGRCVDVSEDLKILEELGWIVPANVKAFMQSFFHLDGFADEDLPNGGDDFDFWVRWILQAPNMVEALHRRAQAGGRTLFPMGNMAWLSLFMDEDMRLYISAGFDGAIRLGQTFEEGMEMLFLAQNKISDLLHTGTLDD